MTTAMRRKSAASSAAQTGGRGRASRALRSGTQVTAKRNAGSRQAGTTGERPSSLASRAYDRIKREIVTGALRPGEYINESHLCSRLGIGRTPVHQAIAQLHQERFVEIFPRKGIIVRPISLDEYMQLDEVRLLLEVGAMRLVAQRITPAEIHQLEQIVERGEAARRAQDIEQLLFFDRDFHFTLAQSTRNPVLTGMLTAAYERSLRVWFMSSSNLNIESNSDEHLRLLKALRNRDGDAAAEIMRTHILSSRAYTMQSG